jgi:general secretion pathway protein F
MRHSLAGSRLTSAMASMLSAGVPLATALAHGAQSTGDEAITGRMVLAREAVIRGERLSRAFDEHSVVRQNVIQLLRAGEASGEVTEMLRTSAQLEAEWGLARIRTFTAMLEPTLILSFGALIAFIAAALLQAVYAIRPVP